MTPNPLYPPAEPISRASAEPWPFLCTRSLHDFSPGPTQTREWRFWPRQMTRGDPCRVCDGEVDETDVRSCLTMPWGMANHRVAGVSVHGEILAGRDVRIIAVSLFSRAGHVEASQFVANPFHGLMEFLKGETLRSDGFILWETIVSTERLDQLTRLMLSSWPRPENSTTCPSPGPGAESLPPST